MNIVKLVEQIEPPTAIDQALADYREKEIETAFLEEFGKEPLGPPNPVRDVTVPSLSELLVRIADAKLAGKTVFSGDSPMQRTLGFVVDEDDVCYNISLTTLLNTKGAVTDEVAAMFNLTPKEVFDAMRESDGRQKLAGGQDVLYGSPDWNSSDKADQDEKCKILRQAMEEENEAVWKPVDEGKLEILRPME